MTHWDGRCRFWRFSEALRVAGVGTPPPESRGVGVTDALRGRSTDPSHPGIQASSPESSAIPIHWEPELAGDRPPLKPSHVWLTRRRWDAYFLAGILAAVVCGGLSWWFGAEPRELGMIVLLPLLWLMLHWGWPREGAAVVATKRTPGTGPLLTWLAVWGVVGLSGTLILDAWLPLPDHGEPLTWRMGLVLIAFLVAWFAGLLLGVAWIERRFKKARPAGPGGLD